jgi:membrane-bound lytic murein transglycosylase B
MRGTRAAAAAGIVAAALVVSGCTVGAGSGGAGVEGVPDARSAPDASVTGAAGAGSFTDGTPTAQLPDPAWLDRVAAATGIPRRALQGYAGAAIAVAQQHPDCHLGWNTLAGIGWVESHHGTIFGGEIEPNGVTSSPIYGVPLDGGDVQKIPDTDKGAVDGDSQWDRAVGPMQIVPATWAAWATDANGDGVPDIHDIDDASLTAAEYLCYSGGDFATEDGWRQGVTAYNESPAYLVEVAGYATRYAGEAVAAS